MDTEVQETQFKDEMILAKNGNPFKSKAAAMDSMSKQGIIGDAVPIEGGYAIKPETFWEVIFSPKSSVAEQDDVHLSVNGETLMFQREVNTFCPGRYLEAAKNTKYPITRQKPGKLRKTVGAITTFPYTVIRQVTQAEYFEKLAAGTKKVRADVDKMALLEE
jgi:hypothetical protein